MQLIAYIIEYVHHYRSSFRKHWLVTKGLNTNFSVEDAEAFFIASERRTLLGNKVIEFFFNSSNFESTL